MIDANLVADRAAGRPFLGFFLGTGFALVAWTLVGSFLWTVVH